MTSNADTTTFLRKALRANAVFSAISGITFLVASGLVAVILDAYDAIGEIQFVAVNLLVFSAFLFYIASRESISKPVVLAIIAADALWVAASWVAIFGGATSGGGTWAVATVADAVLLFAILQWLGLRKMEAGARTA